MYAGSQHYSTSDITVCFYILVRLTLYASYRVFSFPIASFSFTLCNCSLSGTFLRQSLNYLWQHASWLKYSMSVNKHLYLTCLNSNTHVHFHFLKRVKVYSRKFLTATRGQLLAVGTSELRKGTSLNYLRRKNVVLFEVGATGSIRVYRNSNRSIKLFMIRKLILFHWIQSYEEESI
jgi:hypothetical protein